MTLNERAIMRIKSQIKEAERLLAKGQTYSNKPLYKYENQLEVDKYILSILQNRVHTEIKQQMVRKKI